jgi:hypothetical protein
MDYNAICVTARVATGLLATLLIAGCAVEVPKSALPAFRLTPPTELAVESKTDASRVTERSAY